MAFKKGEESMDDLVRNAQSKGSDDPLRGETAVIGDEPKRRVNIEIDSMTNLRPLTKCLDGVDLIGLGGVKGWKPCS